MNKKLLLGLVFVLLVLPLVNAAVEDPSFIFKYGEDIDLKISCFNNDLSTCVTTTNCFLTTNYPNGVNLVTNGSMTYKDSYYNYSFQKENITQTGLYPSMVNCIGSEDNGYSVFGFEVNLAGKGQKSGMAIFAIVVFITLITITLFLIPRLAGHLFSHHEMLNLTLRYGFYLIGLFFLTLDAAMIATLADLYGTGLDSEILMFLWVIQKVAYFAMFIFMIRLIFFSLRYWNIKKHKTRMGIRFDDD